MEIIIKLAWLVLAVIHLTPSLVVFRPSLLAKLYNTPSDGLIGLLLTHRGGLFLAVVIACLISIFHIESRRLAAIVVGISMISFLVRLRRGPPAFGWRIGLVGFPYGDLTDYGFIIERLCAAFGCC